MPCLNAFSTASPSARLLLQACHFTQTVQTVPHLFRKTGENKFTAMMDILEEMDARSGIKPNAESWGYVLKELVNAGDFRMGWVCIAGMKSVGITPEAALVEVCCYPVHDSRPPSLPSKANESNAAKSKSAGTDFPAILKKAAPESFEVKDRRLTQPTNPACGSFAEQVARKPMP